MPAAAQEGAQSTIVDYGRGALIRRVVMFGRHLQSFRARDLAEDLHGFRTGVEGPDRLQGMGALVGQVHARAGLDEAKTSYGAVPYLLLQVVAPRVEVQLVIDGDFDSCRPGKILHRQEILPLDGQGFFDQHGWDARRFRRLEYLKSY